MDACTTTTFKYAQVYYNATQVPVLDRCSFISATDVTTFDNKGHKSTPKQPTALCWFNAFASARFELSFCHLARLSAARVRVDKLHKRNIMQALYPQSNLIIIIIIIMIILIIYKCWKHLTKSQCSYK